LLKFYGMKRLILLFSVFLLGGSIYAQTCTIVDPDGNPLTTTVVYRVGGTPIITCFETGAAPVNGDKIIIPDGVQLFVPNGGGVPNSPTPFHIGDIEILNGGEFRNNNAQAQLDGSVTIKSGGKMILNKITRLGDASDSPCPYKLNIETGGLLDLTGGGASDRMVICGNIIAQSGGGCNSCLIPGRPSGSPNPADYDCTLVLPPYCEPPGGFAGPLSFSSSGLPIELLFFKASKGLNRISLSWATASELNFDYFDIEKSSDGKAFHSIAKVTGHGTTNERKDYSLNDEKPYIGKNYYRLKSVDFDGYTEYFNVVMVDFDGKKSFSVYPNPSDGVSFTAETNFIPQNRAFIAIYSTIGSEIARYEVSGEASTITLPVKLESGVYYAKYISLDFNSTNRVLVK